MKLLVLLFLILTVCNEYAQAQKTRANELKTDTPISGVIEVYQSSIPNKKVELSDLNSRKKFFNEFTDNNLELRSRSDQLNLSIRKRLAGVRNTQMKARNKLKDDFNRSLDSILNSKGITLQEQEKNIQALRTGLVKSAIGLRTVGNREYRYIYYRADTRFVRVLPARNARFSQIYYGELKDSLYLSFLRHQFLTFNEDFGALSSEIVAGYLGPVRVGLNTAISRAKEIKN